MFGQSFYHAATRRFIAVFGTLFNDIHITRTRQDTTTQDIKVPLTYGSFDKMLARLNEDPKLDRPIAGISPALSFVMGAPKYDATRKLQSTLQRCIQAANTSTQTQFMGVPYNYDISLYVYAKEEEDGLKIVEQILPYFTPSLTVTVIMDDTLGYEVDVPIVLEDIVYEDSKNWGSFTDRRYLIWELKFLMKVEFAGPVTNSIKPLIKFVKVPLHNYSTNNVMEEVDVFPGLLANGQGTTNASASIPWSQIDANSNFDYIVQITTGLANT